jgi:WD40 repeat protein
MCFTQVCKPWRRELKAGGFCGKTAHLCSALAGGGDAERLHQNALRRLNASSGVDAERALCLDGSAFLAKSFGRKGSLQEWLQAASQEPDASFLSRGAASTAQSLGLALVQWVGKPQWRYPGSYALTGHSDMVQWVAFSRDGKRVASVSDDTLVKIWNAGTGAEVSSLE